jgi:hypothetical protein
MRATLILHEPPAANESAEAAVARAEAKANEIGRLLGAKSIVIRAGAGWRWEITYSAAE